MRNVPGVTVHDWLLGSHHWLGFDCIAPCNWADWNCCSSHFIISVYFILHWSLHTVPGGLDLYSEFHSLSSLALAILFGCASRVFYLLRLSFFPHHLHCLKCQLPPKPHLVPISRSPTLFLPCLLLLFLPHWLWGLLLPLLSPLLRVRILWLIPLSLRMRRLMQLCLSRPLCLLETCMLGVQVLLLHPWSQLPTSLFCTPIKLLWIRTGTLCLPVMEMMIVCPPLISCPCALWLVMI